jgi:hypothetical protein
MPPPLFHPANPTPLNFAENDLCQIAEPLDTALAVTRADPETPSVWLAVPRTELRLCPMKVLTNPHGRRRVAQAALSPCDWSEKRCVSTDCPSCIPLNAEPVTYRLPRKETPRCPDLRCGLSKLTWVCPRLMKPQIRTAADRVAHEARSQF